MKQKKDTRFWLTTFSEEQNTKVSKEKLKTTAVLK